MAHKIKLDVAEAELFSAYQRFRYLEYRIDYTPETLAAEQAETQAWIAELGNQVRSLGGAPNEVRRRADEWVEQRRRH